MKYHNFKRPLAVILASLLTFSSASFVAMAEETGEGTQATTITYTFRGESSNDDGTGNYTVDVLANGGLINTGFVEITYDENLYSGVTFTPADNIKDASFYWNIDNTTAGTYGVGFMSAAGLSDGDAGLFTDIDNPSTTIAYIDASGTDDVRIGTFTLTFAEGKSYATEFTTAKADASAVTVSDAKYIIHDIVDEYNTAKVDANTVESTMLVFSADDFEIANTNVEYNGAEQAPDVTGKVDQTFTLELGDDKADVQTNAGEYAIKVSNVKGDGYYDAEEIDLAKNFVINKKVVEIEAPVADPSAKEYVKDGFDPANITLSSEDWKVTDTALLNAGKYDVNVKYVGAFDTDNNIYMFNEAEVTNKDEIVATVEFEVTKAKGEVPEIIAPAALTFKADVDQTVAGYDVKVAGWEFVDANAALAIGENKDIAIKFVPEDVDNYTYEGYDVELGYVPGKVTITLNKAVGAAPELPVVAAEAMRLESVDDKILASEFVTNAGVWSYDETAQLGAGEHNIVFTYKPADLDKVDYTKLENWNSETSQFEYTVKVTVNKPYLEVAAPADPAPMDFAEGFDKAYSEFQIAEGWSYADTNTKITAAGVYKDIKVLYTVDAAYDVEDGVTTEVIGGNTYIVDYVDLTVNKIDIPASNITFTQSAVYTGEAIALAPANIKINGLTGVAAEDITLVAVSEVNVGTYDVLATVAETTNYKAITEAVEIGTLEITPAEVTADMFTLEYTAVEYDGNAKMPTVTAAEGVGDVATVKYYNNAGTEVAAPTDYGTYTVKVSGPANGNYKAYADLEVGSFSITKQQVKITAPTSLDAVNYVPGGYDLANLVVTGWTVVTTGKLNAGEHDVTIAYDGDFDTTNYSYIYNGKEVADKSEITATLKLTVNKIAGTVAAPTATQTVTFDPTKADKMASTYATFADGWSIAEDKALVYGANAITVEHAADTLNYTWDGYTVVGEEAVEGKITKVVDVTFEQKETDTTVPPVLVEGTNNKTFIEAGYKYSDFAIATTGWVYDTPDAEIKSATTVNAKVKFEIGADYKLPAGSAWTVENGFIVAEIALTVVPAVLPADAAVAAVTTETYDGSAKAVNVSKKEVYTGLGEFTVSYEGNTNAGTYDVYVEFADGTNYKGGKITLTDYLVINKADVTKDMFTVADYEHKYDGNAKTANVTAKAEYAEIGAPTVTYNPAEVKAVGEYAIIVAGDETANYNAYSNITLDTKLTISKGKIVIQKPESFDDVDYVEGGFDLSTLKMDGWTTISTQKVGAGKHGVTVEYAGTLDTDNYEYEFDNATVTYPPRAYPTIIVRKINLPADPLKIDDNDFTYNGSAQKATVSLKNTLTGVDEIVVTYKQGETVVADPTDAGIYDVYVTVEESNNYYGLDETKIGSYEIKKATVEKTDITLADTEHTYDGSKKTPTATSAKGGTAVVTVTGEAINAGTYTFTVSGEATTNYEAYSFTYENGLVIKRADVKESDFAVSDKSQPYDGSKKAPTVAKVTDGIGAPTITIDEVINAGKYTFTVSGPASENYNAYSFEYTEGFEITKRTITIAKPENIGATNYVPGGINASTIEYPINWAYNDEVDKMLEAGVDQAIKVKYTATLDTANNDYVAGEGVEGNANDGFTSTVTITVNQIAGTIPALTTSYEVTYDKEKADKKVATYVTIESADWALTDENAELTYGEAKYAVETVLDTKNYTYAAVEGVTVGEGKATAEITVKFNKATLPTDAAIATSKTVEYDGNDQTVDVVANDNYKGLGTFNVVYHEGYTDVGVYDITVNFAEGENYKEGSIVIADVLTITKQVLQNISAPTVATEAIVGDEFKGDAGEGFNFAADYVIKEGNNEIKVTKTIAGSFAKNYDYTEAAAKVGLTVTIDETTGDVTLSKTFNVTGKYSTGTLKLTVNTSSVQDADKNTGDVTITILPEGGTAYELATDKFTESADVITVADLVLTEGKYTITVKKQRYLAYVLTVNVAANATTEKTIALVAGDIVGGAAGKEVFGDGIIDIDDFVIAIRAFDTASSAAVKDAADIDESGVNNVTDLGFIKTNFNKTTVANCTEDTTVTE